MKKIMPLLVIVLLVLACNNSDKTETPSSSEQTADSLYDEVMEGHDIGMAKMGKIEKAKAEATRLLDSLKKLPAAAQTAAAGFMNKLDSLAGELSYAETAMNKWMEEMNWKADTIALERRIPYLELEKQKVAKVKEAISGSLQKADSLLRARF